MAVRWAAFLRQTKAHERWKCKFCVKKGLNLKRNCGGELGGTCPDHGTFKYEDFRVNDDGKAVCPQCGKILEVPFELLLGKKFRVWACPVSMLDPTALFYIRLVNWSEEAGVTPSGHGLLDESNVYFEIRNLVVHERNAVEEETEQKKVAQAPTDMHGKRGVTPKYRGRRR